MAKDAQRQALLLADDFLRRQPLRSFELKLQREQLTPALIGQRGKVDAGDDGFELHMSIFDVAQFPEPNVWISDLCTGLQGVKPSNTTFRAG